MKRTVLAFPLNASLHRTSDFRNLLLNGLIISLLALAFATTSLGQGDQSNLQFTEGQVNDSGTLSLSVPLRSYKGRGLDLPISLSYSSDVWKIEHLGKISITPPGGWSCCVTQSVTEAIYSKFSTSGWKSSLALPIIEFPEYGATYEYQGRSHDPSGGCFGYRVREVYIHMPDGSSHTLRKNDQPSNDPNSVDMYGSFYAIDGSRMRFDANGTSDTGTIYMPDGTTYALAHPTSTITDRNGNMMTYNESTRQWTDTLNRVIADPLPASPSVGDFSYSLPGLAGVNGGYQTYTFKWKNLANALTPVGGSTPALRLIGSEALPYPTSAPGSGNAPVANSSSYDKLFKSTPYGYGENGPLVPTLIVGHHQASGQLFDPVVLSEIVLPDGTSYKFTYNVYGEIDKVVYPTNAYDQYVHTGPAPSSAPPEEYQPENAQPYVQALRSLTSRTQSVDGSGGDTRTWTYSFYKDLDGNSSSSITNPDGTKTVTNNYGPGPKIPTHSGPQGQTIVDVFPFGFRDARVGMPMVKKFYAAPVGDDPAQLLRQEVFQYDKSTYNYTVQCQLGQSQVTRNFNLSRTPRLVRKTDFIFEGSGSALAQSSTYQYDTTYEFTTGIDQTLAATYHYVVVANQTAQDTDTPEELIANISLGTLAKYSETTYLNDSIYRNANILGQPRIVQIKDAAGTVVSQSEMVYDESGYVPSGTMRGLPTSMKTWDSTKGAVTNSNAYLVTHATFDTNGNRTIATDAMGYSTTTTYDTTGAYPIAVTSAIPNINPSDVRGSTTAFTSSTTFDPTTGLVLSTTDINGETTSMEYNDALLRLKKVTAPNGHQTTTQYGAGTSESTRWVKVRSQIDASLWSEATSYYDGIGRTYKTQKTDLSDPLGDIYTITCFDDMGRVEKSSNPFRTVSNPSCASTLEWTIPTYDDLGRTTQVTTPDGDSFHTSFALSTSGVIGTMKTITDQAAKKRSGITDAIGRMVRVIEDPDVQNLSTDYVFDTLGNLRKTTQGEQSRFFMHDSLGRVLFAKQTEQNTNDSFSATDPITGNTAWSVKYEYDDNGNITKTTDARGIYIQGTYDRLNRLTDRNYSDSTPGVDFFYDGTGLGSVPSHSKGKTTKIASFVSETRNTAFDSMGRLTASEQRTTAEQIVGSQDPYTFGYTYNLSGALIEETYPSRRVVKNTLNIDGELAQVQSRKTLNTGYWIYADSFSHNAAGVVTKMQLGNGRWENAIYNNRQQVTQMGLGSTESTQDLLRLNYEYGRLNLGSGQVDAHTNNGALAKQKLTVPAAGQQQSFTAQQYYAYDSLNRIEKTTENLENPGQSAQLNWRQWYTYDRYGNRRFDTSPGATTTIPSACSEAICNPTVSMANNRLSSSGYIYDSAGSVTHDAAGQRFGYDAESRQKIFFSASNQTDDPDATYEYDGEGRRVKKVSGSEMTIFVYNASGQLAAEYSSSVAAAQYAKTSYLTADHLGSPRIITDQTGKVISRKDFTAFGESATSAQRVGGTNGNGYDPPNIRQDFTGYQKDEESELEYAQARYFNPGHGRFTSVDPLVGSASIRNPQTFNRYSYVTNSPYKFTDPLGLALQDIGVVQTDNPLYARYLENESGKAFYKSMTTPPRPATQNQSRQATSSQQASQTRRRVTEVKVKLNWVVQNDNGTASVSEEVKAVLNDATSEMATNIYNAMIDVNAANEHPESSSTTTVEGKVSADAGITTGKKGLSAKPTGASVDVGGGVTSESISPDAYLRDIQGANDDVRGLLVQNLMDANVPIPQPNGAEALVQKAGEVGSTNAPNLASSFGLAARRAANEQAANLYNRNFPERFGVPKQFLGKQF